MSTSNTKYNDEYYKVSFVTTHSGNIPKMLRYTGSLIVMSDLSQKDPTTNKNRMSIWLRGETIASGWGFSSSYLMTNGTWWANAYNRIIGPSTAIAFDPSANKEWVDSPTYNSSTNEKPISIENRLNFSYSYIIDTKKEIISTIISYNETTSNGLKNLQNKIDNLSDKHDRDIQKVQEKIEETKTSAYQYTDKKIKDLIGNAPDTLDTLGEISDWLKHAQNLGLDTTKEIMDIKSTYLYHDNPIDGYTYLSEKSYVMEKDEEHPKTGFKYTYNESTGEYQKTDTTYTYYEFVPKEIGTNAVKSEQVSTPFDNLQLSEILKAIITPYPYKYPTIQITKIQNKSVDEWQNEILPVGTILQNIPAICTIDIADAENVTNLNINRQSNTITNCTISNYSPEREYNINIGSFTSTEPGTYIIVESYEIEHGNAVPKIYPQLTGLTTNVFDNDHAYPMSTYTGKLSPRISKTFKYAFFTTNDDALISDANLILSTNYSNIESFFAEGTKEKGHASTNILNEAKQDVRCTLLMPSTILSLASCEIWIVDANTHIKQRIYKGNSANEYGTDIVKVTSSELSNTCYSMKYSFVSIYTNRYPFNNSFYFYISW